MAWRYEQIIDDGALNVAYAYPLTNCPVYSYVVGVVGSEFKRFARIQRISFR